MSKEQAALIRKFEKLNPTTRSIVQAAAAASEPLSRTKLVALAAQAGVLTESGCRPIFKTERPTLDAAINAGVLHYVSPSASGPVVIANEIQDYVFRDAFFCGLAQTIVSEEREPKKNRYRTDSLELETVVRNMRMAFYGGDVKTWSQCSSEYSLRPILLDPFCPESFARLSPEIRALFFEMFSQDLVTQLEEPTAGFRDFVASYVDTLDDSLGGRGERAIVAAIDLFAAQGNLQALRGLGQRLTKPRSEISGCIAFLTGQYATAREQFEQAIKEARGRTKKRRIELRHVPSLFYGALLLKDNTPQSRKTLKELCRTIDDWETPYWVFAEPLLAAHKQQSKPLESQLPRNYEPDFFPPLGCWTAGLVWCWQISDSRAPFAIGHFKQLRDRYRASGLEWLAAEASAILARARDSNDDAAQDNFSRETHAKLGTVSIVELIQPLPAWENGLVALENLCVGDSPAGSVDETTADVGNERIIWQLDYSKSGSWLSPHPYLQKLGKKGWSKGRRVALERLYDQWQSVSFDFLTDQDRAICQCLEHSITHNPYGYRESVYDWNVAALAKVLVGHPNVYHLDDRTQAIEISQSKPYLSITSSQNALRLEVKPSFNSGSISIQQESASRISLVEFSDRQKTIAEMIAGLPEIPASQQDRVARITLSISSMIDIQSDIDGTHGTGETVEAVADIVVQLTPYHEGLRAEVFVQPLGERGPFFRPGSGAASVLATIDGKALCATRELDVERANLERLLAECHSLDARVIDADQTEWLFSESEDALELVCELQVLGERGEVVVLWPRGKTFDVAGRASTSSFQVSVRRDRDWFAASGKLSVDAELTLDMMNLLELVADSPSRFVRLDDGRILALTAELQKRIGDIVALGNPLKKKIRFSPVQALAFETALEGTVAKTDKHWKEHVGRIEEAATIDVQPPSTLQTELRDYQAEGYAWLKRLAHWNTGACLADDMGLGKTIQALALLVDRVWDGPALVVAPASVGFNWESETRKFAPTLTPNLLPPIFFLQFSCPHFPAPKRANEYRSLPSNPEHRVFDGVDQSFQVGREDVTDGTNAKRIDSGDLAWVDHESLSFQQIVKSLEFVDVAAGIAKSSDDGTMQFARENGLESEAVHAIHQDAVVFGITGEAGGDTTFLLQLGHGLCESADDVGGAGETPFAPTVLHRSPLHVKIE